MKVMLKAKPMNQKSRLMARDNLGYKYLLIDHLCLMDEHYS